MEIFEIHITGDEKIIETAKELGIKTIVIELVKHDRSYLRTEHMTSHVYRCNNYDECKAWVDNLVNQLVAKGVQIARVKIECPFYPKYKDQSIYFEVHYDAVNQFHWRYPLSRNQGKTVYLCTAREYDKAKYHDLADKHCGLCVNQAGMVMELCLYDTNVEEDKDWFDLYEDSV